MEVCILLEFYCFCIGLFIFYVFRPFEIDEEQHDFVQGMKVIAAAGDPTVRSGISIFIFTANTSMDKKAFYSSDGDILLGMILHFFFLTFCDFVIYLFFV